MDPASIFALVEGSAGLALKCVSVAKSLNDLTTKYKQSKLTLLSLVQSLDTIQLAWSRIGKWSEDYASRNGTEAELISENDDELFERLKKSLEIGNLVMEAFEEDLLPYSNNIQNLSVKERARMVWNETALDAHRDRIRDQAQSMICLLQIVLLEVSTSRQRLFRASDAILRKSDESAYSIVPSRMSSRFSLSTSHSSRSGASAPLEYRFLSFENSLFTARVYKRNYRTSKIDQLFKSRMSHAANEDPNHANKDPNHAIEDANLLFEQACHRGDTDQIEYLLEKNPPIWTECPRSCLRAAIQSGQRAVIDAILVHDEKLWKTTGKTIVDIWLLQLVGAKQDTAMMSTILKHHGHRQPEGFRRELETQLLEQAASYGNAEMIRVLLDAGAAVDCRDKDGFQPLHLASMNSKGEGSVVILMDYGADVNAIVTQEGKYGSYTPLEVADLRGQTLNIPVLLRFGAFQDYHRFGRSKKESALLLASQSECLTSICALPLHASYNACDLEPLVNFVSSKLNIASTAYTKLQCLYIVSEVLCRKLDFHEILSTLRKHDCPIEDPAVVHAPPSASDQLFPYDGLNSEQSMRDSDSANASSSDEEQVCDRSNNIQQ